MSFVVVTYKYIYRNTSRRLYVMGHGEILKKKKKWESGAVQCT